MISRLTLVLVAAGLFPADSFFAQSTRQHNSRIVGIVIDSLHQSGLEGAEVIVSGLATPAITDSFGRFTIDSLAPGTYRVGVFHPLLESLGLTLATKPFRVGADSTGVANLAIPSGESLARRYCGNAVTAAQPAVVAGRVLDPDSEQPVRGAAISLAWTEVVVSKETGIVRTPHELRVNADSSGFFKFCGLPEDLEATVQALGSGTWTGHVPISTQGSPLTFENLELAAVAAVAAGAPRGTVRGLVLSLEGKPIAGASFETPMWGISVVTKEDGSFSLEGIPTGTQLFIVRRPGYESARVPLNVTSRQPIDVRITMGPIVNLLDSLPVKSKR